MASIPPIWQRELSTDSGANKRSINNLRMMNFGLYGTIFFYVAREKAIAPIGWRHTTSTNTIFPAYITFIWPKLKCVIPSALA